MLYLLRPGEAKCRGRALALYHACKKVKHTPNKAKLRDLLEVTLACEDTGIPCLPSNPTFSILFSIVSNFLK